MRRFIIGALALTIAGCAVPAIETDFDNSRVYPKSKDAVWTNVVSFFATQNIQIKTIEKDSGVIYAERSTFDETMADCGKDSLYIDSGSSASFNVLVLSQSGGTSVTVTSDFKVVRVGPYNTVITKQCFSTGTLEALILNSI